MIVAGAPLYSVITETIGASISGYSLIARSFIEDNPNITSIRLTTAAKTGRLIDISDNKRVRSLILFFFVIINYSCSIL